ncbi:hypothetical protein M405DRAFT_822811 [Rhizopogon salebrosus TDB-379]|nr:hypothetical protein M405DRAFT_822811 [Rhizopogon salebrosus TDB-379]
MTFSMITINLVFRTRSPEVLFDTKWTQLSSISSASCDVVITVTIWWFLQPARTGNIRSKSRDYVRALTLVFIEMGLFSALVAIAMAVLCQFQYNPIGRTYSAATGALMALSYLNSMMTVLNARKSIRERKQVASSVMELPTIPTII